MFCKPMHLNFTGTGQSITHDASWYTHNAIDCWSSPHQLSIPPRSTVNSVDHQSPHCWPLTLCLLMVDHRSPHCWPLTLSLLIVDHQLPRCWLLTLSLLTVDPPPQDQQSTVLITWLPHCWLLTLSLLTIDRWSSHCWPSTLSLLTVDPPPCLGPIARQMLGACPSHSEAHSTSVLTHYKVPPIASSTHLYITSAAIKILA